MRRAIEDGGSVEGCRRMRHVRLAVVGSLLGDDRHAAASVLRARHSATSYGAAIQTAGGASARLVNCAERIRRSPSERLASDEAWLFERPDAHTIDRRALARRILEADAVFARATLHPTARSFGRQDRLTSRRTASWKLALKTAMLAGVKRFRRMGEVRERDAGRPAQAAAHGICTTCLAERRTATDKCSHGPVLAHRRRDLATASSTAWRDSPRSRRRRSSRCSVEAVILPQEGPPEVERRTREAWGSTSTWAICSRARQTSGELRDARRPSQRSLLRRGRGHRGGHVHDVAASHSRERRSATPDGRFRAWIDARRDARRSSEVEHEHIARADPAPRAAERPGHGCSASAGRIPRSTLATQNLKNYGHRRSDTRMRWHDRAPQRELVYDPSRIS